MKKILYLDDNEEYHVLIEQAVNGRADITHTYNLEEAWQQYCRKEKDIDLVTTDYCLIPQTMDNRGLQFALRIRRGYQDSPENREIPIIMCSSGIDRISQMVLEAGVSDLSPKDNRESLDKVLSKYLD